MASYFTVFFKPGPHWLEGKTVFEQPLDDHVEYLRDLYQQGRVIMAGPFADGSGGLTILKVNDEAEAHSLMERDPDVIKGILAPDIRAWSPLNLQR